MNPRKEKPIPPPKKLQYPEFDQFREIYRFVKRFNPSHDMHDPIHYTAKHPVTEATFEAYRDGIKIFEVTRALSPRRRDILDHPLAIDSEERFAWALFCKLKQKRELFDDVG